MSDNGFIKIPRSLLNDKKWESLPLKDKILFLIILQHSAYRVYEFHDRGHLIRLEPGQMCTTLRHLAGLAGKEFSKNDIERGLVRLGSCRFLRQEVRHTKTIITLEESDAYVVKQNEVETKFETKLRQSRDKVETETKKDKEDKEVKNNTYLPSNAARPSGKSSKAIQIQFSFDDRKFLNITPEDLASWKETYPGIDCVQQLREMREWLLGHKSHAPKSQFRAFITRWLKREQNTISFKTSFKKADGDRRTKDIEGNPVDNPHKGKF